MTDVEKLNEQTEGWTDIPQVTRKYHYFRDRRSLCGRYGLIGYAVLEPDDMEYTKNDCAACRKKLDTENRRGGVA